MPGLVDDPHPPPGNLLDELIVADRGQGVARRRSGSRRIQERLGVVPAPRGGRSATTWLETFHRADLGGGPGLNLGEDGRDQGLVLRESCDVIADIGILPL